MVRHNNEDSCLVIPPWSSLAIEKNACLFMVADGMGGQNAGEIASGISMKEAASWFARTPDIKLDNAMVEEMIGHINASVWAYAQKHPEASGMGNTLTMLIIRDNQAIVGHIGDSRLYRLRNGELKQLTNDHTLVAEQVRAGKLSLEAARVHPTRHILSRAIGSRQFVVPDIFATDLQLNDVFMMCSDGISGMIDDVQIKTVLLENNFSDSSRKLVAAANKAGGKDNSTAVVVAIDALPVTFPARFSFFRWAQVFQNLRNAGSV